MKLNDSKSLKQFEIDLEFVQALANPIYLNFLAQNDYFEDERLLNYLEYLEYWRKPEYASFLIYPACLYHLELLKIPQFRKDIAKVDIARRLNDDLYFQWLGEFPEKS